jgi:repressor LexA
MQHWLHKELVMNLTPRQLDVLVAIRNYRHLHGYSPTMQELADQLGTSKVTIFEHVGALEKKRVLRRDKHKARSLEIVADILPDEDRSTKLPLLGNIAAGSPIEAVENREELDLEQMFNTRSGVYVLRVRGESMIDDHLCDGDYVIIERRENARNGEQVVALLDSGEATLKRYYKESGGKIRLQPANANHEPLIVEADRLKVQGVVIGVLRSYH